jgi:hypothetical protein
MARSRPLWLGTLLVLVALPSWSQAADDPVLLARAQRAEARGIPEGDLPPVPRSIVEPPPLPPPELHPRDMKGSRASRATRASRKGGRNTKAKPAKKRRSPSKSRPKSTR